ncbi:LysM peptidoglycan-binding domain-containing protein [Streptomyces tendae]|uniref:LysM peptidoglycan-binding domain-containing protein n=1 Tax=Streptomyces tendae TaxID=1932 RepID=UPI0037180A19
MAHRMLPWPLALLRLLARLAVLAVLVAGVPAVLLKVGTLPRHVPSVSEARDALMAPDDGSLLFTTLTVAAWIAWLWLLVPLLVELVAVLAHRSTPRLPGMVTSQRLAAYLLGGLLLASPAAAATAAPPVAAAATLDQASPAPASVDKADRTATATAETGPAAKEHHVAEEGVVAYDVAEQRLGDGLRWRDVARLNPELHITGPSTELPAGTTVVLPAEARPAAPSATGPGTHLAAQHESSPRAADEDTRRSSASTYTVQPGDTLWGIAEEHQGDPTRYTEIAEANPDVIRDPDLIYPGERLSIPGQEKPSAQHRGVGGSGPEEESHDQDDEPGPAPSESPRASDGEAGTPEQETSPSSAPQESDASRNEGSDSPAAQAPSAESGTGVPSQAAPSSESAESPGRTPAPDASKPSQQQSPAPATDRHRSAQEAAQDEESGLAVAAIALGAGAFVAAGVLLMLRRKRTLQQRRRRAGHRIAMPSGRAAATERTLRCVDAIEEVDFLDAVLRTLAHHCTQAERPLPAVAAVQLGTEGVLLHLADTSSADDLVPLPPFTATEDSPQIWWCPADTGDLADSSLLGQMDAPYPALVALGDDTHEALLLVDLERFGAVHLIGAARLPVLRALGTSLAVSPLSADLEIAVAGEDSAPGLSLVDARVTPYATLADAADVVRTHHGRQHSALSGSDTTGLSAARATDAVDELWPLVVLADLDSCPDPESAEQLAEVLHQEPRTATAIVTSGDMPAETEAVWVLHTDVEVHAVPGTGLHCRLVAFSDEEYADVIESALTSNSESDVAPDDPPETSSPLVKADPAPPAAGPADQTVTSGGLLARLADLDDDSPAPSLTKAAAAPAADLPDNTETDPDAPAGPGTPAAPQPDATSPSRVALPATMAITRVNARVPASPSSSPAAAPPQPTSPADDIPEPTEDTGVDDGPWVRVLGPVDVTGVRGHIDSNRRTVATELVTWLALRPDGAGRHELDDVIAPGGGRVENNTRNARVREVRRWLGDEHYPKLNEQPDRKHRLVGVTCDWHQFQDLTTQAATADHDEARTLLRRALDLVRGRPFTGVPPRRYVWAESLTQDMISAVVDAADDLAARCLNAGDAPGALWAAGRGLDTGREREVLWRHRFEALAQLGAHDELEAAIQQLNQYLLEADLAMERETEETIRRLDAVRH